MPPFNNSRREHERNRGFARIGLEIHGYIDTKEKLFCSCKAIHGIKFTKPNTNICPICTAQPGSKPMLPNKNAVDKSVEIALILGCKINQNFLFQRKHYNWPDLPKGYQNTISGPHAVPVGVNGKFQGIKITECHLEEDPSAWNPETGEIDYNRSGSPLIEIVTEPDFVSSEQVFDWLKQLITTLSYIKALDKTAGIKADVNVSLPEKKGARVEIKNVNSLTNIKNAIDAEIARQNKEGVTKIQETRRYNAKKNKTELMRTKEQAQDYRFISDPDLPIIKIEKTKIEKIKSSLPETPHKKLQRLIKKHKIPKKQAEVLTKNIEIVEFFEKVIEKVKPQQALHWVTGELLSVLNYAKKELEEIDINPLHLVELIKLVETEAITKLKAQEILRQFIPKSFSPKEIAKKQSTIFDSDEITKLANKIIKNNAKAVADFKQGNQNAINFLIGQLMKETNKRADYKTAKTILEKLLK